MAPFGSPWPHEAPRGASWALQSTKGPKRESAPFSQPRGQNENWPPPSTKGAKTRIGPLSQPRGPKDKMRICPLRQRNGSTRVCVGLRCSTGDQTKSHSLYIKKCIHQTPDRPPHGAATRILYVYNRYDHIQSVFFSLSMRESWIFAQKSAF